MMCMKCRCSSSTSPSVSDWLVLKRPMNANDPGSTVVMVCSMSSAERYPGVTLVEMFCVFHRTRRTKTTIPYNP